MKTNAMFLMVRGAGHISVSSISIGNELNHLSENVKISDNLKPFINTQEKEYGECGVCHKQRLGKSVQTITGEHFVCLKHNKLAYKL